MSNLQSDIDYIKSLAEEGGKGPMRNGATLFWAGLLYGLAAIGQYAVIKGYLPRTGLMQMGLWFGATTIFLILGVVFGTMRTRVKGSVSNRAVASVWSSVGLGIVAFIICTMIIANVIGDFKALSGVIAPVILIMYGMGWWVSALMSGTQWLKLISFGCFFGAPAISFLADKPEELLAYSFCLFLFAMVPGWVLKSAAKE
jgi:hypothetical protein